jgi:hypothetical protein
MEPPESDRLHATAVDAETDLWGCTFNLLPDYHSQKADLILRMVQEVDLGYFSYFSAPDSPESEQLHLGALRQALGMEPPASGIQTGFHVLKARLVIRMVDAVFGIPHNEKANDISTGTNSDIVGHL